MNNYKSQKTNIEFSVDDLQILSEILDRQITICDKMSESQDPQIAADISEYYRWVKSTRSHIKLKLKEIAN